MGSYVVFSHYVCMIQHKFFIFNIIFNCRFCSKKYSTVIISWQKWDYQIKYLFAFFASKWIFDVMLVFVVEKLQRLTCSILGAQSNNDKQMTVNAKEWKWMPNIAGYSMMIYLSAYPQDNEKVLWSSRRINLFWIELREMSLFSHPPTSNDSNRFFCFIGRIFFKCNPIESNLMNRELNSVHYQ